MSEFQYGLTITMRRSREEIVSGVKKIIDPTRPKSNIISKQGLFGRINSLSRELQSRQDLTKTERDLSERIQHLSSILKSGPDARVPKWRQLDRSII